MLGPKTVGAVSEGFVRGEGSSTACRHRVSGVELCKSGSVHKDLKNRPCIPELSLQNHV